ncbi:MAG: RsmF rRNA methyltransferase first C-terminal domain-containing protein [Lachnospiraceae bacterium]|nr:RsmF rRNA methyltransferase first C-terminal domain-containing protein [Lachnospiraceae bacterium]
MDKLPKDFCERMRTLLPQEYEDFIESYKREVYRSLRLNPLKTDKAQFLMQERDFKLKEVEWEENGFYYDSKDSPGKDPYHEAGVYYIQEASAMYPVNLLDVKEEDLKILDLCSAPGGKSSQIAGRMKGRGILFANEIVPQRAEILCENMERMGVENALILNEDPEHLKEMFFDYFDRILIDAPCSGEGMFKKNESAIREWSTENVEMCAKRQDAILDAASAMLKPGGRLVYSTCTFSPMEDEECVDRFLSRHSDYKLLSSDKLYPHKIKGEGQFAASFIREEKDFYPYCVNKEEKSIKGREIAPFIDFIKTVLKDGDDYIKKTEDRPFIINKDKLYLGPKGMPKLKGLRCIRPGLWLGSFKKGRFEPSHALALSLRPEEVKNYVNLDLKKEGDLIRDYLKGLTFEYKGEKGFYLICVDGYSLGWGKLSGSIMKNHYPKGLRLTNI